MARLDDPDTDAPNGDDPAELPPVVRATLAFRALAGNASILDLLHRYETSYDRQFMRAQAAIQKLRRQEPQAAEIEATPTLRSPLTAPTFNESTQDGGTPVPQPVSSDLRCSVKRSRGKSSTGRRLFATSY